MLCGGGAAAGESTKKSYQYFIQRLERNPEDIEAGNKIRELCREKGEIPLCIDELNALVEKHPGNRLLRYQAALSYVDSVPGKSLYKKGWLSSRSQDHMTNVLESDPEDWTALYIRGLNNIYWPTSFRRLPKAISDLKMCVQISRSLPVGLQKPYHGLAFLALGDALVKNNQLGEAREIYGLGHQIYESKIMRERMNFSDQDLQEVIKRYRDSDHPVDTDLSFLVDGGAERL